MFKAVLIVLISFSVQAKKFVNLEKVQFDQVQSVSVEEIRKTIVSAILKVKKYQYLLSVDTKIKNSNVDYEKISFSGDYYSWAKNRIKGFSISAKLVSNKTGKLINKVSEIRVVPNKLLSTVYDMTLKLLLVSNNKELKKLLKSKKKSKKNAILIKEDAIESTLAEAEDKKTDDNDEPLRKEYEKEKSKEEIAKEIAEIKKEQSKLENFAERDLGKNNDIFSIDLNSYYNLELSYMRRTIESNLSGSAKLFVQSSVSYAGLVVEGDFAASYQSVNRFLLSLNYYRPVQLDSNNPSNFVSIGMAYSFIFKQLRFFLELKRETASFVNILKVGEGLLDINTEIYWLNILLRYNSKLIFPVEYNLGTGLALSGKSDNAGDTSSLSGVKGTSNIKFKNIFKSMYVNFFVNIDLMTIKATESYENFSYTVGMGIGYAF